MHLLPVRRPNSSGSDRDRISKVQPTTGRRFAGAPSAIRLFSRSMDGRVRLPAIGRQIRDNRQIERATTQTAKETDRRLPELSDAN